MSEPVFTIDEAVEVFAEIRKRFYEGPLSTVKPEHAAALIESESGQLRTALFLKGAEKKKNTNNPDPIKRSDQIEMLAACAQYTDTSVFPPLFTYPNCGWHLVEQGLVTKDKKITDAGRFALWLLGRGSDPVSDNKSFVEITIPLPPGAG